MRAEDLIPKLAAIEETLAERELLQKTRAIEELRTESGLSAASIRKWLEVAVAHDQVVIPALSGRAIFLPGRDKHGPNFPPLWVTGEVRFKRHGFEIYVGANPGGYGLGTTTFVMTKRRCAELVDSIAEQYAKERAEKETAEASRRAKRDAEFAADQAKQDAEFTRLFPTVQDMLGSLMPALAEDAKLSVMAMEGQKFNYGQMTLVVGMDSFPAFERIIRAGLAAINNEK